VCAVHYIIWYSRIWSPCWFILRSSLVFSTQLSSTIFVNLFGFKNPKDIHRHRSNYFVSYRLLVWLTLPVGCLVSEDVSVLYATPKYIVHELTQFMYNAKEAFLNPVVTRTILDHLNSFLVKVFQLSMLAH
jgi:timeless protein